MDAPIVEALHGTIEALNRVIVVKDEQLAKAKAREEELHQHLDLLTKEKDDSQEQNERLVLEKSTLLGSLKQLEDALDPSPNKWQVVVLFSAPMEKEYDSTWESSFFSVADADGDKSRWQVSATDDEGYGNASLTLINKSSRPHFIGVGKLEVLGETYKVNDILMEAWKGSVSIKLMKCKEFTDELRYTQTTTQTFRIRVQINIQAQPSAE